MRNSVCLLQRRVAPCRNGHSHAMCHITGLPGRDEKSGGWMFRQNKNPIMTFRRRPSRPGARPDFFFAASEKPTSRARIFRTRWAGLVMLGFFPPAPAKGPGNYKQIMKECSHGHPRSWPSVPAWRRCEAGRISFSRPAK